VRWGAAAALVFAGHAALAAGGSAAGVVAAGAAVFTLGCGDNDTSEGPRLSALGLFEDLPGQVPAAGVVPFDVNVVLYSDQAAKWRFVALPPGGKIGYGQSDGVLDFPVGTKLIKTFGFYADLRDHARGYRLIETRILERSQAGWTADVYLWNDAQTDAVRHVSGRKVDVSFIDDSGATKAIAYRVPNTNQCASCHEIDGAARPLGPVARQLNKDYDYGGGVVENQLDHWAALGVFSQPLPPAGERPAMPSPFGAAPLEQRARAYLDANCAHCHQPGGLAGSTGLDLRFGTPLTSGTGICKAPVAAGPGTGGRDYVIVPGKPDESIMLFRIDNEEPGVKMPELPTVTKDARGIPLIREWIAAMDPKTCMAP
jgi:uncharacterized repeat protein (TIGR03806 family)